MRTGLKSVLLSGVLSSGILTVPASGSPSEATRPAPAADTEVALPRDAVVAFVDRTPLDAAGQPFTETLRHTFSLSPEQLADAATRHAENRRHTLAAATGEIVRDFSTTRDLLRFPDVSRGQAVQTSGVVREVGRESIGENDAALVRLAPSDAAGSLVAILLPGDVEPPKPGDRIRVAGLFLKIAELPDGDDETPATAALIAAPAFERDDPSTGGSPDPSLWSVVAHRTLGVRSTESGLYYRLLSDAAAADPAALRKAAAEHLAARRRANPALNKGEAFPRFVDLFKNPNAYEGRAVTLTGYAREIRKYPAGENAAGLETLYEVWLFTDDSQGNPAVIVAASAPENIPLGEDLQVPVRATGYFFKIYGYEARDTTRVAPMILAGRLEVLLEPEIQGPPWWLLALLGGILLALIVWLAVSYYGSRRHARRIITSEGSPDFTNVDQGD
ncbi:MAG: hypothetical protein WBC44_17220 [Planctomycetaceae bacterium]